MAVRAKGTRLSADHLELCCFRRDVGASRHALPTHLLASFRCRPGVAANGKTAQPVTREYDFVRFPGRQNGERLRSAGNADRAHSLREIVGLRRSTGASAIVSRGHRQSAPFSAIEGQERGMSRDLRRRLPVLECYVAHGMHRWQSCICWRIFLISFRAGHTSSVLVSRGNGVAGDWSMNNQDEQLAVRKVAVEHHHAEAKRFVDWYEEMGKSRFTNAFAYGRHKVDVLLDEAFKELPRWRTHSGCRLWNRRACCSCE